MYRRERKRTSGPMGTKPRFFVCELVLATKNRGFVINQVKKAHYQ